MTAVLIKSKLFNLVASGRESLFREDASCQGPGSAGPPRAAEPSERRSINSAAPGRIAALPLPAGTAAAIMIFVLTHYIIIRISFARQPPDAGLRRQRCIPRLGVTKERRRSAALARSSPARLAASADLTLKPQSLSEIYREQQVLHPQIPHPS